MASCGTRVRTGVSEADIQYLVSQDTAFTHARAIPGVCLIRGVRLDLSLDSAANFLPNGADSDRHVDQVVQWDRRGGDFGLCFAFKMKE
jgi:hypothetical protein